MNAEEFCCIHALPITSKVDLWTYEITLDLLLLIVLCSLSRQVDLGLTADTVNIDRVTAISGTVKSLVSSPQQLNTADVKFTANVLVKLANAALVGSQHLRNDSAAETTVSGPERSITCKI